MTVLQGIILGVVQGLAEFLPVSSSGHLALVQNMFEGFDQPGLLFDTLLHCATLLAVFVFFRKRLMAFARAVLGIFCDRFKVDYYEQRGMMWGIIIATIPTGIIGYALKDVAEGMFDKPAVIGYFLIVTSLMLFLSDKVKSGGDITPLRALIVGISQGLAVFPGLSRSGTTIFAGLKCGVAREKAAEFSFLISIPAIIGATLLQVRHINEVATGEWPAYLAGMAAAFVCGLFAIGVMMRVVKKARLLGFAIYCLIAGIVAIMW